MPTVEDIAGTSEYAPLQPAAAPLPATYQTFRLLDVALCQTAQSRALAHRLNSICSLYYFTKIVLRRRLLVAHLHKPICEALEAERVKLLIELPRDHFKTSIATEAFPIWRALPLRALDEDTLARLGYDAAFITHLGRVHNRNQRTLIVTEVITNAKKLGRRIGFHYESNDFFRELFAELLPDASCKWTEESMTHMRSAPHGEGTYDFIGVGGALHSRHYDLIIQDDIVGKKAADSPLVMEATIEYHKLLVGAFDANNGDPDFVGNELVIGNRWATDDLNSHIVANEPDFTVISHDALGGCCPQHPEGQPIFPEQFSLKKLETIASKQGPYMFSCQFRNRPVNPETRTFQDTWLRFYEFIPVPNAPADGHGKKPVIVRHINETGLPIDDVFPVTLLRTMVVDPNHSGEDGRCKHAITVVGSTSDGTRRYLLDVWAKSASFDEFVDKIFELGETWKLDCFWLETVAAQSYLKYHIESLRNRRFMLVKELKTSRRANAKTDRIASLVPVFARGEMWIRRDQRELLNEYQTYPNCRTLDVLDTLGYQTQIWDTAGANDAVFALARQQRAKLARVGAAGYGTART